METHPHTHTPPTHLKHTHTKENKKCSLLLRPQDDNRLRGSVFVGKRSGELFYGEASPVDGEGQGERDDAFN